MHWISTDLEGLLNCLSQPHKQSALDVGEVHSCQLDFYDDVEHRITAAGNYLLKSADGYQYISDDEVVCRWQQNKFAFANEIGEPTAQTAVAAITDIRLIEPILNVQYRLYSLTWRDDEDKAVLKGRIYVIEQQCLLILQAIRGYDKISKWVQKLLEDADVVRATGNQWHWLLHTGGYQLGIFKQVKSPVLRPEQKARDAIFSMIVPKLQLARLNEAGIKHKNQDIEYLHDYRVALRKSRSLISLFKDIFPANDLHKCKQEMGELSRRTNLLRDLDVYMQDQQAYEQLLPKSLRPGIQQMFADFAKQHKSAKTNTKRWLGSKTYENKITQLEIFFSAPESLPAAGVSEQDIYTVVTTKLHKRYKKIAKLGSAITPSTPDEDVHELRIECKKFRYLMEFFAQLYQPQKVKQLIKKLKKLQDTLGKFNDYSVQQDSLSAYLNESNPSLQVTVSVGALLGVLAQKQLEQRQQVETKFAEFADRQTAAMVAECFPLTRVKK